MRLSRWALNPVTGVLISGDIWTQREIDIEGGPCEDTGRWWLSRREAWDSLGLLGLTASEGTSPADTLTLDFWPPELRDNEVLLL